MPAPDPGCPQVNAGELARILGVSRRWVQKLTEQQGMPRAGRLYDVAECVQWYIRSLTERATEEPTDIMEARKQLYIAQTSKTKTETARIEGQLVELQEAASLLNQVASVVASQLDAVAPRLAALVAHETDQKIIQQLLFEEHRSIRESVANKIMELPGPGGGDHPTAAESHR